MKIAIISDSHDNIPNIDKMLSYLKKENIKIMLHCGDVCAPAVLKYLAQKFKGNIYLVFGNVDGDQEMMNKFGKEFKNLYILGDKGSPKIKGVNLKIGMVHYLWQAKEMAKGKDYNIIFYGHDHKPWIEEKNNIKIVNPGTLAGLFQKATFAVWDTDSGNLELKLLQALKSTNDIQIYK